MLQIARPTFTMTDTLTVASTVYISGAPAITSGSAGSSYALFVDAGTSRFDGNVYHEDGSVFIHGGSTKVRVGAVDPDFQITGTVDDDSRMVLARYSNDTGAPAFYFLKSRHTSPAWEGGNGVEDGDTLGQLIWCVDDHNDTATAAADIVVVSEALSSNNVVKARMKFRVNQGGAGTTSALEIDENGATTFTGDILLDGVTNIKMDANTGDVLEVTDVNDVIYQRWDTRNTVSNQTTHRFDQNASTLASASNLGPVHVTRIAAQTNTITGTTTIDDYKATGQYIDAPLLTNTAVAR